MTTTDTTGITEEQAFYNTTEVMRLLRCKRNTVIKYLQTGELPGRQLGTHWYIPVDTFHEVMKLPKK